MLLEMLNGFKQFQAARRRVERNTFPGYRLYSMFIKKSSKGAQFSILSDPGRMQVRTFTFSLDDDLEKNGAGFVQDLVTW